VYPKSEILFPHRSVQALKNLRGRKWQKLVERIASLPDTDEDSLAFSLLMIRVCDCLRCDLGSYKASLGCSACARRAVGAFKESDEALLRKFEQAKREITEYIESLREEEGEEALRCLMGDGAP